MLQSFCWDYCGIALPRRINRIEFLATKYNDGMGNVYKTFEALKIEGDDRLQWIDTWAAIDKARRGGRVGPTPLPRLCLPHLVSSRSG